MDTKRVLDQCVRVLQAMIDVSADAGFLGSTLNIICLLQMVVQGVWASDNSIRSIPSLTNTLADKLESQVSGLAELVERCFFDEGVARLGLPVDVRKSIKAYPILDVSLSINNMDMSDLCLEPDQEYALQVWVSLIDLCFISSCIRSLSTERTARRQGQHLAAFPSLLMKAGSS